jgi:hypothetical protein
MGLPLGGAVPIFISSYVLLASFVVYLGYYGFCWSGDAGDTGFSETNTGFKKIIFKQKALRGYLFES